MYNKSVKKNVYLPRGCRNNIVIHLYVW